MPLYTFECLECREEFDRVLFLSEADKKPPCPKCGGKTRKIIAASADRREWEPYWDENLGHEPVLVESREHRERLKKERGLIDQYHHKRGMPGQWY